MDNSFVKIAQLKTVSALRARLDELDLDLPVDDEILSGLQGSPLAETMAIGPFTVGNRWCIHPMEGWDANRDGSPSSHTLRRWKMFGTSGAKLIWGGEAAAVRPDGRANPNQTMAVAANRDGLADLLNELHTAHQNQFASTDDLVVGLQLTHSGRFCHPNSNTNPQPRIAYHHPLLDEKFGIDPGDDSIVWTDGDIETLIDDYVAAAGLAHQIGFQFVDIKSCHGYLIHEFLTARRRSGRFGGDYDGRTRLLKEIIGRVRDAWPDLMIAVRLSAFDIVPYKTSRSVAEPLPFEHLLPYELGFGVNLDDPLSIDLAEPIRLIRELQTMGVAAVNISGGSPYYNPHVQRPAMFPPSDGYQPPEDPLVGVARHINVARQCKQAVPDLPIVGSGYTYLQNYLPHVAQAVVRHGWVDIVGLGRMVLAYPELPADTLDSGQLQPKRLCRTFSDCTTGPRNGMISGCFPLDPYYKALPEAARLNRIKQKLKQ